MLFSHEGIRKNSGYSGFFFFSINVIFSVLVLRNYFFPFNFEKRWILEITSQKQKVSECWFCITFLMG